MTDTVVATSRRREATRQKLLDAAALVFAEVGLDAASVEAVCDRAGFTRGAFYSNFESKEELFLELAARVSRERVGAVRDRIAQLGRDGALAALPTDASEIVRQVLDVSADDRLGVLLMSEVRIHALRNPALAAAYLAQEEEMRRSVAQIISDIAATRALEFRVPADDAAALMLTVWEHSAVRAVMAGHDDAEMRRRTHEDLARVAQLLFQAPAGPQSS
ncbi:TetR/AcrR family transcriptional regulator [Microbacterium thalassium]|uniref:AcrR family transcriptional regulator n=1 Tax=Microbacterium thalassium TaxID=362649 RepID=A0A7X0FTL1_9MICO|nr:TetR/AcrR family transcriptional regulator [Microbacterium thalassium]MBB6392950.1 AcrR family transcriptional regulator [Microbacterium thalassium]GLK22818.1 putative TetR-family regulatory protein [Microbacterium thalassium]